MVKLIFSESTRLTKSRVDSVIPPASGQHFLRDGELKGFALRTTPGAKSFVVEKRIDGRLRRITLGRYPELTVEMARKEALKLLGQIATGNNPIAERENEALRQTTLQQVFDDFLAARKSLKPRTKYDYQRVIAVAFPDWTAKPFLAITKDKISERHQKLGEAHGEAYANLAMRVLRALFNFALVQYEDRDGHSLLSENPVNRLTKTRAWYRVARRQSVVKSHELPAWFDAVFKLKDRGDSSAVVADYLLLLLFTGLRRQEAAQLRWQDVDLLGATLTIPDPKNREPLTLPLSGFVLDLLRDRKASATGGYVFPGGGAGGYLIEPRAQVRKVIFASRVEFTLHDLRRTFITAAESLDISAYAVKRLVNHKMRGDVTAGYIVMDVERLRAPMQRITDYFLAARTAEPADVVEFASQRIRTHQLTSG